MEYKLQLVMLWAFVKHVRKLLLYEHQKIHTHAYNYTWSDLAKPNRYTHNDTAQFSLPIISSINELANHQYITSKSLQFSCYRCSFLRPVSCACSPVTRKFCWRILLKEMWTFSHCSHSANHSPRAVDEHA